MLNRLRKIHWFATQQIGIDLIRMSRFAFALPSYLNDLLTFRRTYKGELTLLPCLHDKREQAGSAQTEYFVQDLLVAQWIHRAAPAEHVDIGSRIDGFVAHVASFRRLTVVDIRPSDTLIDNVEFLQADLMSPPATLVGRFDSVSCLHTLEHFGLGRYGDPLDANGYIAGLRNMSHLVAPGGTFYLSVPVGRARVEFNAHRIFDPREVIDLAQGCGLSVAAIEVLHLRGARSTWDGTAEQLAEVAQLPYALGIFVFVRRAHATNRDMADAEIPS